MGKVPWLARYRYRLARATVQCVRCLRLLRKMSWPQYLALYLTTLGYWLPRYLLLFFIIHLMGQAVPFLICFSSRGR
jgi:glycosyltransferase 2 family protein